MFSDPKNTKIKKAGSRVSLYQLLKRPEVLFKNIVDRNIIKITAAIKVNTGEPNIFIIPELHHLNLDLDLLLGKVQNAFHPSIFHILP
mgnify:CR=1 FL=1